MNEKTTEPTDGLLEGVRFILHEVAMRERLPCELSDDELRLVTTWGEPALMEWQDDLNAHAAQLQLLTPSSDNLSRIEKERAKVQRQALRLIETYTALFSCIGEKGARNILTT